MLYKQVEATAEPTTEEGTAVRLVAAYRPGPWRRCDPARSIPAHDRRVEGVRQEGPVAWNHETDNAEQLIGSVDPATMSEQRDGLRAEARLDLEGSAMAREAWRLVKSDSIGVSFGFMADEVDKGGGPAADQIDLYEIASPRPMHAAARALNWKSATDELPTEADQRRRAARLMLTPQQERDLDQWVSVFTKAINGTKATAPARSQRDRSGSRLRSNEGASTYSDSPAASRASAWS